MMSEEHKVFDPSKMLQPLLLALMLGGFSYFWSSIQTLTAKDASAEGSRNLVNVQISQLKDADQKNQLSLANIETRSAANAIRSTSNAEKLTAMETKLEVMNLRIFELRERLPRTNQKGYSSLKETMVDKCLPCEPKYRKKEPNIENANTSGQDTYKMNAP